jgi:16S rRNA A1518/A1519 N6-dimethyltransferase RsmA/KsgA/DIM1 with predicted DNA glycosylase/AP lyase activity
VPDWETLGIDPQRRAEELGVAEFVAIADYVSARR